MKYVKASDVLPYRSYRIPTALRLKPSTRLHMLAKSSADCNWQGFFITVLGLYIRRLTQYD